MRKAALSALLALTFVQRWQPVASLEAYNAKERLRAVPHVIAPSSQWKSDSFYCKWELVKANVCRSNI